MSSVKQKKDTEQPELPMAGGQTNAPAEAKSGATPAAKGDTSPSAKGNGRDHIVAEAVETVAHRLFDPKKVEAGLHTRVDRGFLD